MRKLLIMMLISLVTIVLAGCSSRDENNNSNNIQDDNVSNGEGVKINNVEEKGSNKIVNTITVEGDTYALFFNVYNMDNAPVNMQITINYNELGNVISMETKMNYGTEKGAQRFADMIKNDDSKFSKIFSNIKVTEEEYDSYLTATLDITYNDYYQEFSAIKSNVEEWITKSKKNIDSDEFSLYDSYEETENYYKETYHGYTIKKEINNTGTNDISGNKNIDDNKQINDINNNPTNDEYDMPFTDKEFGTYKNGSDTVKIYKDGNKVHVIGTIDNYEFDFAFNNREKFNVGNTKKFNVYYQYDENYSSSIYFDELDSEGNSKAFTNLAITDKTIVAAGYGHETTTSTILNK